MKPIRNVSDLRVVMHRNERPIYFISATNFNLLGIDQWVRNFKFINYIDCFDGRHPKVMCRRSSRTTSSNPLRTLTTICFSIRMSSTRSSIAVASPQQSF